MRFSAAAELIVRWFQIRGGDCRHRKTNKVFQSKANRPLSTVNKFEQVQRGPEVNKLNRYRVTGAMEGPHVIEPVLTCTLGNNLLSLFGTDTQN